MEIVNALVEQFWMSGGGGDLVGLGSREKVDLETGYINIFEKLSCERKK